VEEVRTWRATPPGVGRTSSTSSFSPQRVVGATLSRRFGDFQTSSIAIFSSRSLPVPLVRARASAPGRRWEPGGSFHWRARAPPCTYPNLLATRGRRVPTSLSSLLLCTSESSPSHTRYLSHIPCLTPTARVSHPFSGGNLRRRARAPPRTYSDLPATRERRVPTSLS